MQEEGRADWLQCAGYTEKRAARRHKENGRSLKAVGKEPECAHGGNAKI